MCDDFKKQILLEDEVGAAFRHAWHANIKRLRAERRRHAMRRWMYYHGHLFDVAQKKINAIIALLWSSK